MTRWVALMIQLEQQQHREFVVGWVDGVGGLHQVPISSLLGLDQLFYSVWTNKQYFNDNLNLDKLSVIYKKYINIMNT